MNANRNFSCCAVGTETPALRGGKRDAKPAASQQFSPANRGLESEESIDGKPMISTHSKSLSLMPSAGAYASSRGEGTSVGGDFEPTSFGQLEVGDRFVSELPPGIYFKTGSESFGVAPGEGEWESADLIGRIWRIGFEREDLVYKEAA